MQEVDSEVECLRKFRASPVPAHVFLPLYDIMTRSQRQKRMENMQQRKVAMLSLQRVFNFAYEERHRSEMTAEAKNAAPLNALRNVSRHGRMEGGRQCGATSYNDLDYGKLTVAPKMTLTSAVREATTRRKDVKSDKGFHENESAKSEKRQKDLKELRRNIASKATAFWAETNSRHQAEKLKTFREADKARLLEYRQEMKNMMERVKNRPLLMERQLQICATRKVDKRFKECLQQEGIDEDLVLKQSLKAENNGSLSSSRRSSEADGSAKDQNDEESAHESRYSEEYDEESGDDDVSEENSFESDRSGEE